ncbi:hypothetical protein ZYGR_0Z02060 [Zygosaccharomyces rouxii]|uniref:Uncharacterized protein n=1 Tax=Zygosaccharomyces rouxii TaxID=4956 RepID=A0A1Q3A571_ZYGRO|nr:hypothetical protein ZYGR_0Z02060 [Zygosaccharomyces rouxii]
MNRVRELIGGQHSSRNERTRSQRQDVPQPGMSTRAGEDQETLFENDTDDGDGLDDTETLNTVASGGDTIGDFQRQGFVNRCPRFTHHRMIPFILVLLTKGFFCFPSEKSFKKYIENKRKFDKLDGIEGLGIPLFHAVPLGVVKTIFSPKSPIMKIYKYVIIDSERDKPPPDAEQISVDGSLTLYKYLFCSILEEINNDAGRVEHKFNFTRLDNDGPLPQVLTMANMIHLRNTDTTLNGLNLRWYGTSGFASPFGTGNIKLLVLDDNMASFMDQKTVEEYEHHYRNNRTRPLGRLPIWAKYSNEGSTVIPKKRTLRMAKLQMGEYQSIAHSDGIFNVPWETQALTCMCMVLHEYESRKDRRRTGGLTLGPDMIFM